MQAAKAKEDSAVCVSSLLAIKSMLYKFVKPNSLMLFTLQLQVRKTFCDEHLHRSILQGLAVKIWVFRLGSRTFSGAEDSCSWLSQNVYGNWTQGQCNGPQRLGELQRVFVEVSIFVLVSL